VTASAVVIVSAVVLVAAGAIAWWHGLITLVLGGVWFVHELRLHRQRRGR
jgi:heme O synthase-like polyprenyltransferase